LKHLGTDDRLVNYLPEDKHNVVNKRPNIDKARLAFGHDPKITLEQGIPITVDWMRDVYAESIRKAGAASGGKPRSV
jgi:dTDP-glucose 4,6-dehydratase